MDDEDNVNDREEDEDEDDEESTKERVTAESYGALNTVAVHDECWLIRCPPKLYDLINKVPDGTDVGELIFTKGGTKTVTQQGITRTTNIKPAFTIQVSEDCIEKVQQQEKEKEEKAKKNKSKKQAAAGPAQSHQTANLPRTYSLQAMTKKVPLLHPFVRNSNTGSVELLGTVSRSANLQVESNDGRYRALLKDRLVATNITASRFVKPVELTESVISKQRRTTGSKAPGIDGSTNTNKKSFGNAIYQYGKRMLEAAQDNSQQQQQFLLQGANNSKKARQFSPDQSLRSVLFELFSLQQYWTVKDLKAAAVQGGATHASTKRAEAEIRELLREMGDYHRSGDHKNMWELRKEFQNKT